MPERKHDLAAEYDRRDREALAKLPPLQVGSLVVATRRSGVCDPGERGVVYEAYQLGDRPGWSVIFQSGRHDGFSPSDVAFFLDVPGDVCEALTSYAFVDAGRLAVDFDRDVFVPALGGEGNHPIMDRRFSTETWNP